MTQRVTHKIHKSESISDAILASRQTPSTVRQIVLPDGDYFVNKTIRLDHCDSGLTIRAENPGKARLFGGQKLTGWQPKSATLWRAQLPRPQNGEWDVRSAVSGYVAPRG